ICKPAEMEKLMENDVFMAFSTYAAIVILKMMLMAPMTAYYRLTRGAFANDEDVSRKPAEERKKLLRAHPDVERVRRCHQNDLENIIPFVVIGLLYALSGPELSTALLHFRLFTGSRIFHTIAYVGALPQPSRGLSWMLGMLVTFSMAYRVLSTVCPPLKMTTGPVDLDLFYTSLHSYDT
uniref:Microsomal glutathione S-transferase 1 n=2 Tax=Lates calcarifer TaxID=8187 RepID=A0A4W6D1K4_LATCA